MLLIIVNKNIYLKCQTQQVIRILKLATLIPLQNEKKTSTI